MRQNQIFLIAFAIFIFSCRKDETRIVEKELITSARTYFEKLNEDDKKGFNASNHRLYSQKIPVWEQATIEHLSMGDAVVVPISIPKNTFVSLKPYANTLYKLTDLMKLVIVRDTSKVFHSFVITFVPDSASTNTLPTGITLLEDWQGNSLHSVFNNMQKSSNSDPLNIKAPDSYTTIQSCIEIDGYNYSPGDPENGEYWTETYCSTYGYYVNDALPANIATTDLLTLTRYVTTSTSSYHLIIARPGHPISDITTYLGCFTNGPSVDHTYSVQICVDQPEPGTREAWGFTPNGSGSTSSDANPINTGHTFLIFTENSQGNIISRNVGFYPSGFVAPTAGYQSSQGILNDDQVHGYNISLTINVSNDQFVKMLNYVSLGNNTGYYYNINTNNCSTFAIHALAAGSIYIPTTIGGWPGGAGFNPGDLGEDIRKMTLTSKMSRNTVDNFHPNIGSCD